MEGLELFAGSSPAERALAAKLQLVQGELAEYKEELRYAEARVSAHARILRLLDGEPLPGMCSGCYLKLKRRVRALESEHLSSVALEAPAPKDEPAQFEQGEGLEIGVNEVVGKKGVESEQVARPVRTARRLPRQIEGEKVNEGLAALSRIIVAPLQREHSTADSVAAVIDSSRLAAAAHGAGRLAIDDAPASVEGGQEESQGEVEISSHEASKRGIVAPSVGGNAVRTPEREVSADEPAATFQEDSGDCSVNGGLKERVSEEPAHTGTGQSPYNKSDYKSGVEDDLSSEEGSTARAGGDPLETGGALVGQSLGRVVNMSNKSTGSSASSIAWSAPESGKEAGSRGGSSEGAAESEWKDALDGQVEDEDELQDDGDSKAPIVSPSPAWKGGEGLSEEKGKAEGESAPDAEVGALKKVGSPHAGGSVAGKAGAQGAEVNHAGEASAEGDSSTDLEKGAGGSPVGTGRAGVDGSGESSGLSDKVDTVVGESAKEGPEICENGEESGDGEMKQGGVAADPSQSAKQPETLSAEPAADADDVNEDEPATDEPPPARGDDAKPEEESGELAAGAGVSKSAEGQPAKVRRRVAPSFTLFAALKDAAKTTQEGQSMHRAKQERMERLLRQKAEREAAELDERGRPIVGFRAAPAEAARSDLRLRLEKGKESRVPARAPEAANSGSDEPPARDAKGASDSGIEHAEGAAVAPAKSFSEVLASRAKAPQPEAAGAGDVPERASTEAQREVKMRSKRDFVHMERDRSGRLVNILQGLELHTPFLSEQEQATLVKSIYRLQQEGREGRLMSRTFTQPRKWMRGKGRVTIQFGCCYNYAVDKLGNPPGILRDEEVDPIPPDIEKIIERLVDWGVMPADCRPDSCIVNIYDEGDCIPPHIDHHDFLRPFCTLSLLSEADIVFGTRLEPVGEGDFDGPVRISLPVGSVLILNGNGADVAKHCIPGVPAKRISITLRTMDPAKAPYHLTQTAIHTPFPAPPPQQPPPRERGSSADSWRRAPEAGPAQGPGMRSPSPALGEEQTEKAEEAWPELGGEKKKPGDTGNGPEVAAPVLKGVWGKRQEEKVETEEAERPSQPEGGAATGDVEQPVQTSSEEAKQRTEPSLPHAPGEMGDGASGSEPEEKATLEEASELKPKPSDLWPAIGPWAKILTSNLRAAAPPFEAPPMRLASPSLDALPKKMVAYERGSPTAASFESPPRARGVARPSSTSLTSSPAKKWAATTETPVAAASDLAMAVQKMVGGEGGQAAPRAEGGARQESAPPESGRVRAAISPESSQQQGLGLSAAAPEFALPRKEGGAGPRSGGLETKPTGGAKRAESLVEESASWADIEVETESPRRGGWQRSTRGASADLFDRPVERPPNVGPLFARQMRGMHQPGGAVTGRQLRQGPGDLDARLAANLGGFADPRLADRTGRVGADGYLRERGGGLDRWGHDDRGFEQDPFRSEERRRALGQDELMYGPRGMGSQRWDGGPGFRDGGFARQGGERDQRGERVVTHSKAEALREAGGW